jgi:Lrp/AsnC family leucine-responsive transcriptional regulator
MNRSRYVTRQLDKIDRAIIAALTEDGRITIRELADQIDMSSPSVTDRILKLKDAGAITGYTVLVDLLNETPQVVEAHRVTGADCFVAKVVVCDAQELETVVDRFLPFASTDTAIIQSSTVARRLPKL